MTLTEQRDALLDALKDALGIAESYQRNRDALIKALHQAGIDHAWLVGWNRKAERIINTIKQIESSDNKTSVATRVGDSDGFLITRSALQRLANLDAFNAPKGAAMEIKIWAQQLLNTPVKITKPAPEQQWVSVSDSLPDAPERVYWTFSTKYGYQSTMFKSRGWAGRGLWGENPSYSTQELGITYWSLITPPPSVSTAHGGESG